MMKKAKKPNDYSSELSSAITRRDFVGGTLVGAGAGLLGAVAPALAGIHKPATASKDLWTGYGGVGDYASSNGNVASVREAAHLIRDGYARQMEEAAIDSDEEYDMVIVGGGFSGMGAAYQFHKKYGDSKKCLILENHPVYGGEAKQNEFDVDGHRLYGPQGSNGFSTPLEGYNDEITNWDLSNEIFRTVGMPMEYNFVKQDRLKTTVKTPLDSYESMFWGERKFDTGYFVEKSGSNGWIKNPWHDKLARMPWSDSYKSQLNQSFEDHSKLYPSKNVNQWLDSMTYKEFLETTVGLGPEVTQFADPLIAIGNFGLSSDVISAYAASRIGLPGFKVFRDTEKARVTNSSETEVAGWMSFPGGNTGYLRHIVKYLIPNSIEGGSSFEDVLNNPIDFSALDTPKNPVSIRLNSTAIDVSHAGPVETADHATVSYYHNGKVKRMKAKSVVMSIGGWVARNIVSDMPVSIKEAYNEFHHGPVLVVNVALRNWRFLNKLGISSGRWFEGFGSFFSIRRPMVVGDSTQPFEPEKPTVMTFYVPFNYPGHSIKTQGVLGRTELLSKSYRQYEQEIIGQMTKMFASSGFEAKRDVAGIVLNRWGHAYISPQPGFFFGKNGNPAPREVVQKGFGRIQFGHSELTGKQNYVSALDQGGRAADDAMKWLS
jgi:spermidine dehydrogenase